MKNNPLHYLTECVSTNDDILQFLPKDKSGIFALYTFHQKKGRGQYGNHWHLDKDKNIAITIALPTILQKLEDAIFNFYTAVLLREFIANMTDFSVSIKWPNDLIINHKKIAGILIEKKTLNTKPYYLIGIGINVLQKDFKELHNGGSLFTETKKEYDLHKIADGWFTFFKTKINTENPTENQIIQSYENYLYGKDKIRVFEINKYRQNGIIQNVDRNGYLYIDLEMDGVQKFYHKEVILLY